jgi:hypothetical protein
MLFGDILLTCESMIRDTGNNSLPKQHIVVEVFFFVLKVSNVVACDLV